MENEFGAVVRQMFNALDPDGSGTLGVDELRDFARILGVKLGIQQAKLMIDLKRPDSLEATAGLDFDAFKEFLLPPLLQAHNKHLAMQRSMDARVAATHYGLPDKLPPGDYDPEALGCLPLDHAFRIMMIRLVSSRHFENLILLLIIASALLMAMENPLRTESDVMTDQEQRAAALETVFVSSQRLLQHIFACH